MKLISLLPFMENQEIKELAEQIISGEVKGIKLVVLFPFLGTEDLEAIVDQLVEKNDTRQIMTALPFVSNEKVSELYDLCKEGKLENCKESVFLPFLGKDKIKEMVKDLVRQAKEQAEEQDLNVDIEIDEEDFETEE